MKSSKKIQEEIERACLAHETAYRRMLRDAAKLKKLDGLIRRLGNAKSKARRAERDPRTRFNLPVTELKDSSN